MFKGDWYIFGAKSTAIGLIRAIKSTCKLCSIKGVIVSSVEGNPEYIEGYKVEALKTVCDRMTNEEKHSIQVIVATPVYVQEEIKGTLNLFGISNIFLLDSKTEAKLMKDYYESIGLFPSVECTSSNNMKTPKVCVLKVRHPKDKVIINERPDNSWEHVFWAGVMEHEERKKDVYRECDYYDDSEDNIAIKNPTYCELDADYWAWRNLKESEYDYFGLSHYRRSLDVDEQILSAVSEQNIDVLLPYPMIHVPNIKEHHTRYTNEGEWEALLLAIKELYPEYYNDYERIFSSQYMYNYNMFIVKRNVFFDYCEWLFRIDFRTEEIVKEKKIEPAKRYLAYYGESLLTLYFMHNANKLNIKHVGRLLFQ